MQGIEHQCMLYYNDSRTGSPPGQGRTEQHACKDEATAQNSEQILGSK